jgi:uncharacterized protein YceH (UPF0502 family)
VHDLSPEELRVLGCLLEKQRTTPDTYPLSLNALRAACNQSTNRDPVVQYDEATIRDALDRLGRRRFTRLTSYHGSRTAKFRHLLDEALAIGVEEQAVLAVLMLRGPQTPGELRTACERLYRFADLSSVEAFLEDMAGRGLTVRLAKVPGSREHRWAHLLGGPAGAAAEPESASAPVVGTAQGELRAELIALREEVAEIRRLLDELREKKNNGGT